MWDRRYFTDAYVYGTEPSMFLQAQVALLVPGERALALADMARG